MADNDLQKQFGLRVRDFRKANGLSQEDLAEKIGTSAETVSNIERGRTWPRPETVMRVADALAISPAQLFNDPLPVRRDHRLVAAIVETLAGRDEEELQAVLDQTRTLLRLSSRQN